MNGPPVVQTKHGKIIGTTGVSFNGDSYLKFLGIPYAKPPVEKLRFKAPQQVDPWEGTKNCTKDGNAAICYDLLVKQIIGSEDCLYLNVHTRELSRKGTPLKPVMAYIHAGGFTSGTGTQKMAGADMLMTQDIVYVSMNYRLGIFGFLSINDESLDVPGNAGLKDQTLALKWIQENISTFGGDPNNVTIFGISAGGAAVQFQLISPTATGLFHKAIVQSGSVLNPWAWGRRNVVLVAEKLHGKKMASEEEALEMLLTVTPEKLIKAGCLLPDILIDGSVRRPFGPIIEKPNPTMFLGEDPVAIFKSGRFNQVPIIQGFCEDEGLIFYADLFPFRDIDISEGTLPWLIKKQPSAEVEQWKRALKQLYFPKGVTTEGIIKEAGDILFNLGVIETTKMMIKTAKYPIYFYVFAHEGDMNRSFKKMIQQTDKDIKQGIGHGQDMTFLFPIVFPGVNIEYSAEDKQTINDLVKIWTDFARTGKPHANWEPCSNKENKLKYFRLHKNLELLTAPFDDRVNVWEKIVAEAGGFDLLIDENVTN